MLCAPREGGVGTGKAQMIQEIGPGAGALRQDHDRGPVPTREDRRRALRQIGHMDIGPVSRRGGFGTPNGTAIQAQQEAFACRRERENLTQDMA
jgi:hypothetical protein